MGAADLERDIAENEGDGELTEYTAALARKRIQKMPAGQVRDAACREIELVLGSLSPEEILRRWEVRFGGRRIVELITDEDYPPVEHYDSYHLNGGRDTL